MKYLILLIILITMPVIAGGPGWKVMIQSIEQKNEETIIRLQNLDNIYMPFQACSPLTVITSYEGEPWHQFTKTWSTHVKQQHHKEAIKFLLSAQSANKAIIFSYLGTGIVPKSKRNICTVISKALNISAGGVASFHDPI